ncbi:anhydro-N-acetylmuramic acid kinase [Pseudochelatococcus lubricantis]|uniref:Anhydro-N-acetylmuramic acid kinase n=1 Tax=Pseudochelatococcus lubricantis TaxID=1538102 RepID=A0ABX0UWQ3_9HYPH|nr:anhydro-N-acetylmuramic acid kinase [Pseudochelatococcus lubricantis]NIJ57377.1 anhydro-N-acetylmuramic acid kinase [Pseudochelatococcus lubricantis]
MGRRQLEIVMSEGILRVIGLMSGTSMDGIDVALVETDGEIIHRLGPAGFHPYDTADRALLRKAIATATTLTDREARPDELADAEDMVTHRHIRAIDSFLSSCQFNPGEVDLIGFHGQTVLHRPEAGLTVQIGDGQKLATHVGVPVVYDFRAADVAVGGQGAPLVPLFHRALVRAADLDGPVAVLNLGGVANVTYVESADDNVLIACDTGPANALIDDFMLKRTGIPIDRGGVHASQGKVNESVVSGLMHNAFFLLPPPKSLDRNAFDLPDLSALSVEDGAATLTEFSARAVAHIVPLLPHAPRLWIVCGGGAHNAELVRRIGANTGAKVIVADDLGWSGDAMEAQAFAYLAVRSLRGLPLTLPGTTGVAAPTTGGVLAEPAAEAELAAVAP